MKINLLKILKRLSRQLQRFAAPERYSIAMTRLKMKLPAFSMIQMVVVLIITCILTLTAWGNFQSIISWAKSMEAQSQLENLQTLEKTYFYLHSKYSSDTKEVGYEPDKPVTDGGNANYKVEIVSASSTAFKARATAIVDFDADGIFNVWEVDQDKNLVEVTKD
jgi:type IV pilus assembly protein PilE